jgi:hypothetical protein
VVGGDGGGGEVTADETGGSGDPDVHGGGASGWSGEVQPRGWWVVRIS